MRWSIPIGRVFGITLRLHVTFLLFLALIGYAALVDVGARGAIWTVAFVCAIFACIVLHELGHSVVAQQFGVEVKGITLLPIGGVAALRAIPENPWHEIAITLAGPMVNAAIAAVLILFVGLPTHFIVGPLPHDTATLLRSLVGANLVLFLFNFIPAFPMDGGRLLRAVLALFLSYRRATVIAATVGQAIAILFVTTGLFGRPFLPWMSPLFAVLIGVFIFMGAEGEERMVRMRALLRDLDVDEVMSREFATLAPTDTVGRGLEMVYQTGQDDFPVMAGEQFVGMVTRPAMLDAVNRIGSDVPIAEVMDADAPVVPPRAKVSSVYGDMISERFGSLPVMQDGRLVGLLSPDNISRYILVQSSIKLSRRSRARRHVAAPMPARPPVISGVPPIVTPPPRAKSDR